MVGDDRCCKLFVFRGDRRLAIGMRGYTPVWTTGVLVHYLVTSFIHRFITYLSLCVSTE